MTIKNQNHGQRDAPRRGDVGLATAFTLVVWVACLAVGTTGLLVQYFESHQPATRPTTEPVEVLSVEIKNDLPIPLDTSPLALADVAPAVNPQEDAPPPLTMAAAPSPAIAFELPIEEPAQVAPVAQADAVKPREKSQDQAASTVIPVRRLVLGQGEGRQPPPQYPREALLAHQQGTVTVLINVGESGQIKSVQISKACRWPILNQAALRVVRDQWRFSSGPVRRYECEFVFQITEQ